MKHEERIRGLEGQLEAEEAKIRLLMLSGKIPTPSDYKEIDRIKRELKAARRVRAMDSKRIDPKLTRKITILLPEEDFQTFTRKAAEEGVDLSKYIRMLLKKRL